MVKISLKSSDLNEKGFQAYRKMRYEEAVGFSGRPSSTTRTIPSHGTTRPAPKSTGAKVLDVRPAANRMTFTPTDDLTGGTSYTLTIGTGAQDADGHSLWKA